MNRAPQFVSGRQRLSAVVVGLVFLALAAFADNPNSIIYSRHNLSVSSPGPVHATTESDVCVFCHAPHGASATDGPLWNHQMSAAAYTPYSSATLTALNVTIGQPNGSSRPLLELPRWHGCPGAGWEPRGWHFHEHRRHAGRPGQFGH